MITPNQGEYSYRRIISYLQELSLESVTNSNIPLKKERKSGIVSAALSTVETSMAEKRTNYEVNSKEIATSARK